MRKSWNLHYVFVIWVLAAVITGCSNKTDAEEAFRLDDIYSVSYDTIDPQHLEKIGEWLEKARESDAISPESGISFYTNYIGDDRSGTHFEYVYAKGVKDIEVTFVYSADMEKGSLHIAKIVGGEEDETFIEIKYDPRYVIGSIHSDRRILPDEGYP